MSIYCTYLTTYHGNKLPPFYIGYSTVAKVQKGYHGSVSSKDYKDIWQQETRDHPELFQTKILTIHSTRQDAIDREILFQRHMKVATNSLYTNKAIGHHCDWTGYKHTPETIEKIRLNKIGRKHTIETREKVRRAILGRKASPEAREKMRQAKLGTKRDKATCEKIRLKLIGNIPWNKGLSKSSKVLE